MSRRQGVIGSGRESVEPLPSPYTCQPVVTAEVRVYYPPNATFEQIKSAMLDARFDAERQIVQLMKEARP